MIETVFTKPLMIRIEPEMHRQLKIISANTGLSISVIVRNALKRVIKKKGK